MVPGRDAGRRRGSLSARRRREARRAVAVLDPSTGLRVVLSLSKDDAATRIGLFERPELAEPSGQHRTQRASSRYAQETVALSELTVFVSPTGDERLLETERA